MIRKAYKNKEGRLHRVGRPANINIDGQCEWWINGQRHRVDGPAVIYPGEIQEWWLNDVEVDPLVHFLRQK